MFYREILNIDTESGISLENITEQINSVVERSGFPEGICHVFLTATTAGLMINEDDAMLLGDFKRFFEEIIDENKLYNHASNAFSHLRASLLKTDIKFPVANNSIVLGEWQSIFLWEFDNRPRERDVVVTVIPSMAPEIKDIEKEVEKKLAEEESTYEE